MPNPFASAAVREEDVYAWPALPDVASLHAGARQALEGALARARRAPQVVLIKGEAGDGKTHLLAWLRRQQHLGFSFVAVPPLHDAARPFRHALRHVVAGLRRPDPDGPADGLLSSPLARLLWHALYLQALDVLDASRLGTYAGGDDLPQLLAGICEQGGEPVGALAFAAAADPLWSLIGPGLGAHLQALPGEGAVDAAARAVLCQYPDEERRDLCVAWLSGEDLGERQRQLGVAQAVGSEAAARRVLTALCRLSPQPLALGFDGIEGIADRLREPGLLALCEVVQEVARSGGSCLQVIACHAGVWDSLCEKLERPDPRGALAAQKVLLGRIEPAQVRELILARLDQAFSGDDTLARPRPGYPFLDSELSDAALAGLANARQALRHFEDEFERRRDQLVPPGAPVQASAPPPTTDAGIIEEALRQREALARQALPGELPGGRATTLRALLKELCEGLRQHGLGVAGWKVAACDPILGGGLRLTLQPPAPAAGKPELVRAAVEICNADAGPGVFSATSRLSRQVSDGRAEMAVLLREEGLPLTSGVGRAQAQVFDAQLGRRGGILWLGEDDVAELLAVERVLSAASAGEVAAGPRAFSRGDALRLLLLRDSGPPQALRRLLERVQQVSETEPLPAVPPPSAVPERVPAAGGRSGRATVTLGTVAARGAGLPSSASARSPAAPGPAPAAGRPTQQGLGIISLAQPPAKDKEGG